ncbi:MAG TPA: ATP-grasp domain-containing protein [Acidimicrobiia bacterium]|nr:ATP-grasp domain-containing protein [Acidimicrobiia bacterium]
MNVIFVEPSFPNYQRQFVRGLAQAGASVIGIGERPQEWLDDELKGWLTHYEQVPSVVDIGALEGAVRFVQSRIWVDRLEATIEAHILPTAVVREQCAIPGTSVRTAFLCRDKPAMKEALRQAGIPSAQSIGADNASEVWTFAQQIGYPLIIKPRDAAGASGTFRVDSDQELSQALASIRFEQGVSVAVEEFIEGHEGFYDTVAINGEVALEFASHYYPNVLEAMRTRWISPVFITTNRIDSAPGYDEVKLMGRRVIPALGIGTSATHMEWFFGPKGLKFSEIGCRPPGVGAWDLYCAANDLDLYREWAMAICYGRVTTRPSRNYSAGIVALRPDRDGVIAGYEGLEEVRRQYGEWIIDFHTPDPGTPTQPVEAGYMANAWVRMRHPDYDTLREMLARVGEIAQVRAA